MSTIDKSDRISQKLGCISTTNEARSFLFVYRRRKYIDNSKNNSKSTRPRNRRALSRNPQSIWCRHAHRVPFPSRQSRSTLQILFLSSYMSIFLSSNPYFQIYEWRGSEKTRLAHSFVRTGSELLA